MRERDYYYLAQLFLNPLTCVEANATVVFWSVESWKLCTPDNDLIVLKHDENLHKFPNFTKGLI